MQPDLFSPAPHSFEGDSLCCRLATFFASRPGEWIDGRELALVAGAYAWRSRVSDLRRAPFNLTIENRQRKVGHITVSEYRLVRASDGAAMEPRPSGVCCEGGTLQPRCRLCPRSASYWRAHG